MPPGEWPRFPDFRFMPAAVVLLSLFLLLCGIASTATGTVSRSSEGDKEFSSSPGEVRVKATVSADVGGRAYAARADGNGFFSMQLRGRTRSVVTVSLSLNGKRSSAPARVMQVLPPDYSREILPWNILLFLDFSEDIERYQEKSLALLEDMGEGRKARILMSIRRPSGSGPVYSVYLLRGRKEVPEEINDGLIIGRVVLGEDGLRLIQCPAFSFIVSAPEPSSDMGGGLRSFLSRASPFPSKNKLLLLSLHGDGFRGLRSAGGAPGEGEILTLDELKMILSEFKAFDLLCFDACRMATIEVSLAISGVLAPSGIILASPVDAAIHGWPLSRMAGAMEEMPVPEAGELAGKILSEYSDECRRLGYSRDFLTLIRASCMPRLREAIEKLSVLLKKEFEASGVKSKIMRIRNKAAVFTGSSYVDLGIFAGETALEFPDSPARQAALELRASLGKAVSATAVPGDEGVKESVLAAYFPSGTASEEEEDLSLYRKTWGTLCSKSCGWPDFITSVLQSAGGGVR
jgi:hypothetical protein